MITGTVFNYTKATKSSEALYDICLVQDNNYENTRKMRYPESKIIESLRNNVEYTNISLSETGTIKGKAGSLKRFETSGAVVLSVLVDEKDLDTAIGYRVLFKNGNCVRYKTADAIKYAQVTTKQNKIPFQNAIFVDVSPESPTAFIKSYPDAPLAKEILSRANNKHSIQQTKKGSITFSTTPITEYIKSEAAKFTKEQIEQLQLGIKSGVFVSAYANPAISAEKMKYMRLTMELGYDVRVVAHPDFIVPCSLEALKYVLTVLSTRLDVRSLLNAKYTVPQLTEIHTGLIEYLDINEYADPNISAHSMSLIRKRLEGQLWTEYEV